MDLKGELSIGLMNEMFDKFITGSLTGLKKLILVNITNAC